MLDLAAGRIDGYISDIPALLYYTKDKPQFEVVERIPTGEKYSIMFAKDAPLAAEVNEVDHAMKKEGFIAKLAPDLVRRGGRCRHHDREGRGHAQAGS